MGAAMIATFTDHPGGDIFESGADVLVNPVNCFGVSGKGLALEFKRRLPTAQRVYETTCRAGRLALGCVVLVDDAPGRVLIFPTKHHWRDPSTITAIRVGLADLAHQARAWPTVGSIAIPALGCGLGGLDWADVRPLIVDALADLPLRVMLYPPHEAAP